MIFLPRNWKSTPEITPDLSAILLQISQNFVRKCCFELIYFSKVAKSGKISRTRNTNSNICSTLKLEIIIYNFITSILYSNFYSNLYSNMSKFWVISGLIFSAQIFGLQIHPGFWSLEWYNCEGIFLDYTCHVITY